MSNEIAKELFNTGYKIANKEWQDKIKDKIKQIDEKIIQIKNNNTFVHYDILDQTTIRKLEYAKSKLEDLLKEN